MYPSNPPNASPKNLHDLSPASAGAGLAVALRHATAAAHEAVEQLPIMRRLTSDNVTRDDYRDYLEILASIYIPLETLLYRDLDPATRERLGVRPKVPQLLRDLEEQTVSAVQERDTASAFAPCGTNAIVGGLYVLEGATLGGRTIARHLRRILGDALGGATFLDFHGEQTSSVWKRFAAALDELVAEGVLQPKETIAGALAAFAEIHRQLEQITPRP